MFLPDTNVWIRLIKGRNQPLISKWRSMVGADIVLCSIVKAELWHGAHKYELPDQRRRMLDQWLAPYHSFSFDDHAARHYASVRHYLETRGQVIGPNDLKIAAICLAHGITLVTSNTGEFHRVPGLVVEDWVQPQG
ncbi:MAG: type II toxin-antitoxin system VapC family toxin [Prosthecobacter sp.]